MICSFFGVQKLDLRNELDTQIEDLILASWRRKGDVCYQTVSSDQGQGHGYLLISTAASDAALDGVALTGSIPVL